MDRYLWNRILAHGAGAPVHHAFMTDVAERLAEQGVTVVRNVWLCAVIYTVYPRFYQMLSSFVCRLPSEGYPV
ncbi:alpha/beta family hydrolase [Sansalvadorimonas verongulae]|uniref:alpha/beta family hydrolase n=1 Tax=Sansalvadorimonas verongulae TaxID=2172824 RepID=UPI002E3601C7|nr:alpha/beta family hydrolase [Sansalvadorimonas verongulae]